MSKQRFRGLVELDPRSPERTRDPFGYAPAFSSAQQQAPGWLTAVALILAVSLLGMWWLSGRKQRALVRDYKRGVELTRSGHWQAGMAQLERFRSDNPDSKWADDALWALAEGAAAQNQGELSRRYYQTLIEKYPESKLTEQAFDRLQTITGPAAVPPPPAPAAAAPAAPAAAVAEKPAAQAAPVRRTAAAEYTVQRGDTLGEIAKKLNISVEDLRRFNGLKDHMIFPGQVLKTTLTGN